MACVLFPLHCEQSAASSDIFAKCSLARSSRDALYAITQESTVTISPGFEGNVDVIDFYTDDNGRFILELLSVNESQPLSRTPSPSMWSLSSVPSIGTIMTHDVLTYDLHQFCELVICHRCLRKAEIVSAEAYAERRRGVLHRFLILKLIRPQRRPIWARLDRRAGVSFMQLAMQRGVTPTKDTVQLCAKKATLIGEGRRENEQIYATVPTLMELHYFLRVINKELTTYTAWPANCYFFCSLIQEHLGAEGEGKFIAGALPYPDLARSIREQVNDQVRLFYHMPQPFTLSGLVELSRSESRISNMVVNLRPGGRDFELSTTLENILYRKAWPNAMWLPQRHSWLTRIGFQHSQADPFTVTSWNEATFVDGQRSLANYVNSKRYSGDINGAHDAANLRVKLAQELYKWDTKKHKLTLASALSAYGVCLRLIGRTSQACAAAAEAVAIGCPHSKHDYFTSSQRQFSPLSRKILLGQIREAREDFSHNNSLWDVGYGRIKRVYEASGVVLAGGAYSEDREEDYNFLQSLLEYGVSLRAAGYLDEACEVGAEEIAFNRFAFTQQPMTHWAGLCRSMRNRKTALLQAGRSQDACAESAEITAFVRSIYEREPGKHQLMFLDSLRLYAATLEESGQYDEACEASSELVARVRQSFEADPRRYRDKFSTSLHQYATSLRSAERFDDACAVHAEQYVLCLKHGEPDTQIYVPLDRQELDLVIWQYDPIQKGKIQD